MTLELLGKVDDSLKMCTLSLFFFCLRRHFLELAWAFELCANFRLTFSYVLFFFFSEDILLTHIEQKWYTIKRSFRQNQERGAGSFKKGPRDSKTLFPITYER